MRRIETEKLNEKFEKAKPQEIVDWAVQEFAPRVAATSSFGPESGVLLHMVSRADKKTPILFLDTGFHFEETLGFKKQLVEMFALENVRELRADELKRKQLLSDTNDKPFEADPERCCQLNKVEPLDAAVSEYDAWMSGIRRHQTDFRKSVRVIEEYEGGFFKISPLVNFTSRDAWWYLKEHKIPMHPLYEKGYLSVGCWPCTKPIQAGDDERSGRWAGKAKTECGIHTFKEVKRREEKTQPGKVDQGGGI